MSCKQSQEHTIIYTIIEEMTIVKLDISQDLGGLCRLLCYKTDISLFVHVHA